VKQKYGEEEEDDDDEKRKKIKMKKELIRTV
jgi:hypothetical protein